MKKVVIHKAGGYQQLKIEESSDLHSSTGHVVVEVKASGINYADIIIRWGLYESAKQLVGWPITPGFEFAGIVKEVGENVSSLKVGDRVFGISLFNAYASEVLVPEKQVYHIPSEMSFVEAASIPAVFMTAYHALFQNVVIRPGMTALIHSAAGGVGSSLVQLCRVAGINSIGVVGSSHKVEPLKKLGCDFIIDKSEEDLWRRLEEIAPKGVDLVFDANGISTLKESYNHLAPCGKLIAYGAHSMFPKQGGKINYVKLVWDFFRTPKFSSLDMTSLNRSLITFNLSFLFNRQDLLSEAMNDLLRWLQEGKIKVPPTKPYPFEKVAEAHKDLESGKTVGKLVLMFEDAIL